MSRKIIEVETMNVQLNFSSKLTLGVLVYYTLELNLINDLELNRVTFIYPCQMKLFYYNK